MDSKYLYIIGAGTYGAAILDLAESVGYKVKGFFDDDLLKIGNRILGIPILGSLENNIELIKDNRFAIAIGNNDIRLKFANFIKRKNGILPNLIHPKAEISKYSVIGEGCIVHANSFIWTEVELKDYSIISPSVVVAHHSIVGTASFISTGSNIGAGINIGENCFIGIGATIMTGVKNIGKNCVIGAGSTVIRDIENNKVVVGNPARIIKDKKNKL